MSKGKIEKKYVIDGVELELARERNNYKLFINADSDILYITDKAGNVMDIITADCGQNSGYMEISEDK